MSPVRSSRLTQIFGPPNAFVRFGRYWSGVGRAASLARGNELNFMGDMWGIRVNN